MKNDARHWAHDVLDATLERNDLERLEIGTVFLVDPEMRQFIDGIITQRLWPAVLAGFRGSAFRIHEQNGIFDRIRTKRSTMLTRELVFLIDDPVRPITGKRVEDEGKQAGCLTFAVKATRSWRVRGVLDARFDEYFIGFELSLEFPGEMDAQWLARFLMNPELAAATPSLAGDPSSDGPCYVLTLSRTLAGRYGDPQTEPERIIPEAVRTHLDIIWAADLLADRLKGENNLSEELEDRTAGALYVLADKLVSFYGDKLNRPY